MAETSKFSELLNCRIKFKTFEGTYKGDVRTVIISNEKMILQNCVFLNYSIHVGTLIFMFNEVSDVEVISKSSLKPSLRAPCLGNCTKSSESTLQDFTVSPSFGHLPSRVFLISSYGAELKQAISDLKMSTVIGVSLEGLKIGRFGLISYLCASSKNGTYLFDLKALGGKVFDHGLRRILESSSIEKVIHDCRQVSDALYHLYDTKLSKVFDTQTAEAFVNLQTNGSKFRGFVNSIDTCLQTHLNISEDYLPQPVTDVPYHIKVRTCLRRPTSPLTKSIMIKNVIYLTTLRDELKQKMLSPFRGSVEAYLNAVASKSDRELKHNPHDATKIPAELLREKFEAVEYKMTRHKPINEDFNLPYTGEYSFVNELNELRKQNPHADAEEIHSKLPKVHVKRGSCNYPEAPSFPYVDSRSSSGIRFRSNPISNELASKSGASNPGVVPEKKGMVLKTSTHPISSVSSVKNELPTRLPINLAKALKDTNSNQSSISKNTKLTSTGKNSATEAKLSKPSPTLDSSENNGLASGPKVRIGNSRILKRVREILKERNIPFPVRSYESSSEEQVPSEEVCQKSRSALECEKEAMTVQDSCDEPQYKTSDYNTAVYDNGSFSYLPRKKESTYDPDNPWSVFKSKYPENDSVCCNLSRRCKFVPAGRD